METVKEPTIEDVTPSSRMRRGAPGAKTVDPRLLGAVSVLIDR